MRFGSVCSGIEAASVAWHPLGWKAAWLAEIEPFPAAVLAHHYPEVPNLGDMTALPDRIASGEVEAPDLFCGGTPCQAFSVAGLRKSLDDARGNLSLVFCEIANEIDAVRSVRGERPCIVFWENVPGVLNTKDNAFGCFLAGLAGEDDPLVPPGDKWTNAGVVLGPQRAVAWRVLDAQYFGVAQRRRRVFVVASAREDFDPAAVLFEFDGVRRDTAPSREAGKVAPTIPSRSTAGGGLGTDFDLDGGVITMAHGQGGAEIGFDRGPCPTCNHEAPIAAYPATTHTLRGEGFDASEDGTGRGTPLVPVAFHPTQDPISNTDGSTHALGCGSSGGQASIAVAVALRGREGGATAELGDEVQNCLRASSGGGDKPHVLALTLRAMNHANSHANGGGQMAVAFQPGNLARGAGSAPSADVFPTLKSDHGRGLSDQQPHVLASMQVRRLTPRECEALQGFPPDYTAIPWRNKPADQCPDGPRYKALGNSWAVPNVRWIGQRIANAIKGFA